MATRSVRDEPPADRAAHVLRGVSGSSATTGSTFDRDSLESDARANHERYGFWGISVWLAVDSEAFDAICAGKLQRAPRVAVMAAGDLYDAGVTVYPTGQSPHHDLVVLEVSGTASGEEDDLVQLLDAVMAVRHTVTDNDHYDAGGAQ